MQISTDKKKFFSSSWLGHTIGQKRYVAFIEAERWVDIFITDEKQNFVKWTYSYFS
jgi:hypothetical protein